MLPLAWFLALVAVSAPTASAEVNKMPVTVMDGIRMIRLEDSDSWLRTSIAEGVAKFSPNGRYFIIGLKEGNPQDNTNKVSLLLYQSSEVLRSTKRDILLTMASSTNRDAIRNLKWLNDNETIAFLGENPGELPQVRTLNIRTRSMETLTTHATPIVRFSISDDADVLVFYAHPPVTATIDTAETRRKGLVVSKSSLMDMWMDGRYPRYDEGESLFMMTKGGPETQIRDEDYIDDEMPLSLSPDGRYAVVEGFVRKASSVPQWWELYRDADTRRWLKSTDGPFINLLRYLLLDTKTARLTPLVNTPRNSRVTPVWAPDGGSVLLIGARLPLNVASPVELEERERNVYVIEVRIPSHEILKIRSDTDNNSRFDFKWMNTRRLLLEKASGGVPDGPLPKAYEKHGTVWQGASVRKEDGGSTALLDVALVENMNTPPKVYVSRRGSKRKAVLLDLNPQFAELAFGKVERVTWNTADGHEFWGGLYWPVSYAPGKRYPLVIQTHGFNPDVFSIEGTYSPGAARALAAKNFFVLQVSGPNKVYPELVEGPEEALIAMAAYEGAVNWLGRRGLIAGDHVGLQGFSRTVYYVAYTLTHSKQPFGAAIMADGINAGYFDYIAYPDGASVDELFNGGLPWGKTAASWWDKSPGFRLDTVQTPVRLETHGTYGAIDLLSEWEWFSGLSLLKKPVEAIYIPDGGHILVKPWDKAISQQGAVDWFAFWLKNEEDPDPAKAEQYGRWHELRKLRDAQQSPTAPSSIQ